MQLVSDVQPLCFGVCRRVKRVQVDSCVDYTAAEVVSGGEAASFMANERLRALEDVEKEIAMILQCAGEDAFHQTAHNTHVFII